MDLQDLRNKIDSVDQQLVTLLNKRAALAQQVGTVKKDSVKFRPSREASVVRRAQAGSKGPLSDAAIAGIFRQIISACLNLEQPLRVAYLGPKGTYSEEAARARFGEMATLEPYASLDEALRAAENGRATVAVLPIENSTEGAVNHTLDLLLQTPLRIVGEVALPIRHQLLTHAASLQGITEVVGHPQALAQCREWLQVHVPHVPQRAAASNGAAAAEAAHTKAIAAIASVLAAQTYKVPIVAGDIQDDPANTTRFIVVGDVPTDPTGADTTSLVCSVPNTPGSLGTLITELAKAGVNMTKLASRPSPSGLWDYVFYIDIDGHAADPAIAAAVAALQQRATFVKVLGSYPREVQ